MTSRILIDSSIWIDYLRYKPSARQVHQVNELLLEDKAAIIAPILYEVLVGARNEVVYESLQERLSAVTKLEVTDAIWAASNRLGFLMRCKGFTLPVMDVLISATAIHYNTPLLHADRHFDIIAKHSELKTV